MLIKKINLILALIASGLVITACSTVDSQAVYNSAAPRNTDTLATPPGLSSPDLNSSYKMTVIPGQNSYQVPNITGMAIKSGGSQRWLVIESQNVNKIWPSMRAYVTQLGLAVKYQNQAIGVIQTDWASRNTKVPQGEPIRDFFSWVGWGSMYSLDARYMYRITLWQDGNNVVVMATNYEMDETYEGCSGKAMSNTSTFTPSSSQQTKWIPVPSNPQLELEFLTQYMVFSGMSTEQVKEIKQQVQAAPKEATYANNQILVSDNLERAWWRTGLALERTGLGVLDKNRTLGEYYVYPLQAQLNNPDPSFLQKWFSNESSGATPPKPVYTVKLTAQGNAQTVITLKLYDAQSVDKDFAANQQKYLSGLATQLQ